MSSVARLQRRFHFVGSSVGRMGDWINETVANDVVMVYWRLFSANIVQRAFELIHSLLHQAVDN